MPDDVPGSGRISALLKRIDEILAEAVKVRTDLADAVRRRTEHPFWPERRQVHLPHTPERRRA